MYRGGRTNNRGQRGRRDLKSTGRHVWIRGGDRNNDYDTHDNRVGTSALELEHESPEQQHGCFPRTRHRGGNQRGGGGGGGLREIASSILKRVGMPVKGRHNQMGRKEELQMKTAPGYRGGPRAGQVMLNQIKVLRAKKYGKDFVLRSLSSFADGEPDFLPLLFRFVDNDAVFFLESDDAAEVVKSANRRITPPDSGQPLTIMSSKAVAPYQLLTDSEQELIKQSLEKRYFVDRKHLDLSDFYNDPIFRERNFNAGLNRNNVIMCVTKLVAKHCADLQSVDLSSNRIRFLDYVGNMVALTPHVKQLDISYNGVEHIREFEKLRGWPLTELNMDNNPLCLKYNDQPKYISDVHRYFPNVTRLDSCAIEASEKFGLDASSSGLETAVIKKVPQFKPGFYVSDEIRELLQAFVLEYLNIYDGDQPQSSRQKLLPAYDDSATFTMVMQPIHAQGEYMKRTYSEDIFRQYRRESHNIVVQDMWRNHRDKLVHRGALNVVAALTKLPATKHVHDSMMLDVSFATDHLILFTLTGLVHDGPSATTTPLDDNDVRYFTRSFLVASTGPGKVAILNEQLFLAPVTEDTIDQYRRHLEKLAAPADVSHTSANTSGTVAPTATPVLSREQLVARFSAESGMKPDWSVKCLEDNDWSFERAAAVFRQMKEQNVIPADAFAV